MAFPHYHTNKRYQRALGALQTLPNKKNKSKKLILSSQPRQLGRLFVFKYKPVRLKENWQYFFLKGAFRRPSWSSRVAIWPSLCHVSSTVNKRKQGQVQRSDFPRVTSPSTRRRTYRHSTALNGTRLNPGSGQWVIRLRTCRLAKKIKTTIITKASRILLVPGTSAVFNPESPHLIGGAAGRTPPFRKCLHSQTLIVPPHGSTDLFLLHIQKWLKYDKNAAVSHSPHITLLVLCYALLNLTDVAR